MKNKLMRPLLVLGVALAITTGCEDQAAQLNEDDPLLSVAELSSQLSTGTDVSFTDASTARYGGGPTGYSGSNPSGGQRPAGVGGMRKKDPNLAVVSMAERLGQVQNMRMLQIMGADVKHYDANGGELTIDFTSFQNGSEGFHKKHEAMADVASIVIDFSGTTSVRGTTVSGKVTISRLLSDNSMNETIQFENFAVNGSSVDGIRTIQRTFDRESGEMHMTSDVADGKITLSDGEVLNWISTKKRDGYFTFDDADNLVSGYAFIESSTALTKSDGAVWYSHSTTSPVKVDMVCSSSKRQKPVTGTVQTTYNGNTIAVDFGDGSCGNRNVSVTINGVKRTRPTNG